MMFLRTMLLARKLDPLVALPYCLGSFIVIIGFNHAAYWSALPNRRGPTCSIDRFHYEPFLPARISSDLRCNADRFEYLAKA